MGRCFVRRRYGNRRVVLQGQSRVEAKNRNIEKFEQIPGTIRYNRGDSSGSGNKRTYRHTFIWGIRISALFKRNGFFSAK
jgi:hypothetical protein